MDELALLKDLIEEEEYPYFEDSYLQARLTIQGTTVTELARELCIIKSGIPEMKLGDIHIPSPRDHFLRKAWLLRPNMSGTVVRGDGQ